MFNLEAKLDEYRSDNRMYYTCSALINLIRLFCNFVVLILEILKINILVAIYWQYID